MRVAQRNYRNRQNTTLKNLKGKIEELQSKHDRNVQEFSSFCIIVFQELLEHAGPDVKDRLNVIARRFLWFNSSGVSENGMFDALKTSSGPGAQLLRLLHHATAQSRSAAPSNSSSDSIGHDLVATEQYPNLPEESGHFMVNLHSCNVTLDKATGWQHKLT